MKDIENAFPRMHQNSQWSEIFLGSAYSIVMFYISQLPLPEKESQYKDKVKLNLKFDSQTQSIIQGTSNYYPHVTRIISPG